VSLREPAPLLGCAALFPPLHERLMEALSVLDGPGWERPTRAGAWRVRDVAAHLLDGDLRKLSFHRDRLPPPPPASAIDGFQPLVGYLDQLNRQWVEVSARLSTRVLLELLRWSGPRVADFVATLDPFAEALFPVAWAGESRSLNWMDTAREYTERWHHQQQVREAVGAPLLEDAAFLRPVIHASVRALPRAYQDVAAETGTCVVVVVAGPAGGSWTVQRGSEGWMLREGAADAPTARVALDERFAWRLLLKALPDGERSAGLRVSGDARLAGAVSSALAVMA
jgi:uncharacterized protein (TIGR03083 family)